MLISIITINYNNLEGLKRTMQSVFKQTYNNIEYLVIDGGSTDGCQDYIETHQNKLNYWVSEPDDGVYDAMNKGIDQATGDYLLFLNSGDWLFNNFVIENFIAFKPVEDILYGNPLMHIGNKWSKLEMPLKMDRFKTLIYTLSHQSEFYKRSLFDNNFRYDTSYKVVSDWILTNNAIIFKNCTTRYIDLVVCYFDDPGISSDLNLRIKERKRYLETQFDPLFLSLLTEYKLELRRLDTLKKSPIIRLALWFLQKKGKVIQYFKNK